MSAIIKIATGGSLELEPGDGAFAYGEGLFETIQLRAGGLCFWRAHWARLAASAEALGFVLPQEEAVLAALREWLAAEGRESGIVKLSLVRQGETCVLYIYGRKEPDPFPGPRVPVVVPTLTSQRLKIVSVHLLLGPDVQLAFASNATKLLTR